LRQPVTRVETASDQYEIDRVLTLRNRARLHANKNLLYWYRRLYQQQFAGLGDPEKLRILEIGSGVSPLKRFHQSVITSDVLNLDYLDHVFDCHEIDKLSAIPEGTLDVISLTNVLHHLQDPISFLHKASSKLKVGGKVIAAEPYFSILSTFIFRYLHHETVAFKIDEPILSDISGPLASANIALPWLIFTRERWLQKIREDYDAGSPVCVPYTGISYFASGGISHRIPIPAWCYRLLFALDSRLSQAFPSLLASFFTVTLTRKKT
jgi:SAM-dependent methyltransferase